MTLESKIADINKLVAEQTAEYSKLTGEITAGLTEIDTVAQNMAATHTLIKDNHQAINDWQTKTGKVTLKDLNGQSYQVDTLPSLIGEAQKINPHPEVMTKAQFDALREMRKQQYAGSGFVEWGRHNRGTATKNVNVGIWQYISQTNINAIIMGEASSNAHDGISSSLYPKVLVDNVIHHVSKVAHASTQNLLKFPPAPDGSKTYDSAKGILTEHDSPASAFEGQFVNGSLRLGDTTGWKTYSTSSELSIVDGSLQSVSTGNQYPAAAINEVGLNFPVGTRVRFEFSVTSGQVKTLRYSSSNLGHQNIKTLLTDKGMGRYTVEYIADHSAHYIWFEHDNAPGNVLQINNVSAMPVTEQVVTSRKDLVFLESWHEKIADKDVVYPLGNVQYGASAYEGITLANTLVAQGYSAFGQWDSSTKGYGVKWSTLSDVNRVKFLKNPQHNIYYDPEAKAYIQVRYRIRVVEGKGDNWTPNTVRANFDAVIMGYRYGPNAERIAVRGARINNEDYSVDGNNFYHNKAWTSLPTANINAEADAHVWIQRNFGEYVSHNNTARAVPIALVQRLNQGVFHPVYNPSGTASPAIKSVNGTVTSTTSLSGILNGSNITSALECFVQSADYGEPFRVGRYGETGKIGFSSGYNGIRPWSDKYHDTIYSGQVEDLRLNANKQDVNQLREETIRKAVAGTLRGKDSNLFTKIEKFISFTKQSNTRYQGTSSVNPSPWRLIFNVSDSSIGATSKGFNGYKTGRHKPNGSWVLYKGDNGKELISASIVHGAYENNEHYFLPWIPDDVNGSVITPQRQMAMDEIDSLFPIGTKIDVYLIDAVELSAEFDSLPWVDIIGHPERIAETFPDGVVGQWIPQLPNGGSQDFKLNRKASQPLTWAMSLDDGSSWSSGSLAINSTKNAYVSPVEAARVQLIYYCADAGFTAPAVNSQVLGAVGDVWLGNDARSNFGARLQQSLTSSIATTVSYTSNTYVPLNAKNLLDEKLIKDEFPQHAVPPSLGGVKGAYACKALPSITNYRGLLYMQFHGAQLQLDNIEPTLVLGSDKVGLVDDKAYIKIATSHMQGVYQKVRNFGTSSYDSYLQAGDLVADQHGNMVSVATGLVHYRKVTITNWGDDQTIPVIDNENVKTDLNGNTMKVFCHHTLLPLGIASH
ncbi:hypothetical protein [Pseudoalteromonas byunsanensis]|uniref:Uncharacterized protein n=1 Tax=Pseudoalteromonas byunsanensis TaxID=327939 RepID=A0A1S1NBN1_9GAMM|nr:hypothetical protein [Pseudoalteromonas byunsanensis]OHU96824.1 hypothetical protein BIW53_05750 [Pseudoalteromonas byunsanensis]